MNTINVVIDFEKGINRVAGIDLVTGDYASTKIKFTFDNQDGTKIFEMKNPSGQSVFVGEITNNEVVLTGIDDGENYSIFNEAGKYVYEVSLYNGDTKLTSVSGEIPVRQEQVVIGDETIEPYMPIFDELMQQVQTAITETNNLNITGEKVGTTTTITITNKNGTPTTLQVLDGEQGPQGEPGVPGAVKFLIVNELPTQDIQTDAIYLVPSDDPSTQDLYLEYMYINNQWELLGQKQITVDLTNYVQFTNYASSNKAGVVKNTSSNNFSVNSSGAVYAEPRTYAEYQNGSSLAFIGKTTLENVITGKGLVSNTNYASTETGGVIKVNAQGRATSMSAGGTLQAEVKTYQEYGSLDNQAFISKGTLNNVLTAQIGDINSVLDAINGEVI